MIFENLEEKLGALRIVSCLNPIEGWGGHNAKSDKNKSWGKNKSWPQSSPFQGYWIVSSGFPHMRGYFCFSLPWNWICKSSNCMPWLHVLQHSPNFYFYFPTAYFLKKTNWQNPQNPQHKNPQNPQHKVMENGSSDVNLLLLRVKLEIVDCIFLRKAIHNMNFILLCPYKYTQECRDSYLTLRQEFVAA